MTEFFRVLARRALDAHRVLRITIRGTTGIAPNLFGAGDSRALSFMLTDIAVRPMRGFALEPGMSIPFGQGSLMLLLENWLEPDLEWVWSPGGSETRLQLQFSPLADDEDEIHLGLDLEVYSGLLTRGPATLKFFADETEIATVIRAEAGFRPISFGYPARPPRKRHSPACFPSMRLWESANMRQAKVPIPDRSRSAFGPCTI